MKGRRSEAVDDCLSLTFFARPTTNKQLVGRFAPHPFTALEHGSSIVPAFSFEIDGSYGFYIPKGKIVEKIGRAIGFLPMMFWGR